MNPTPRLTMISPCFHDEGNIETLVRRLEEVCHRMGVTYEIVLVDDGSSDGTWEKIRQTAGERPAVRGIRLTRNQGHQAAVSAGLAASRGERVLIIDSDLEDPPELLPEMMAAMDAGAENVYGVRLTRPGTPAWRRLAYKAFYRVLNMLAGSPIPADSGDFRLISRRVVDAVNAMPEKHRFLRGMISWLGYPSAALPYHREPRHSGRSGYTLRKLFLFAVDGITSFSIVPLRLATLLGLLMSAVWMAGAAYVLVTAAVFGVPVSGWASLMVVTLFMGSMNLLVLGILGEYLGRLFIESKGRPVFVVGETTEDAFVKNQEL